MQRHINVHVATELLEMMLLAAGEDWYFILSMVCRRWWEILSSWRTRGNRCLKLRTPYAVGLHSVALAIWSRDNGMPLAGRTFALAASYGRIDVLKYLKDSDCPWDSIGCSYAAARGYVDVLQWLRSNDYSWDALTCVYAARHNQLPALKFALDNGCPSSASVTRATAQHGHLAIFKFTVAKGRRQFLKLQ